MFFESDHDIIPDFSDSILTGDPVVVAGQGAWSTHLSGDLSNSIVHIADHVIFDVPLAVVKTVAILPGGKLEFLKDQNLELRCVNLMVFEGGELEIGTETSPVTGLVKILIRDVPLDTNLDPSQYSNGLLVAGKFTACGQTKTSYLRSVNKAIAANDISVNLPNLAAAGWLPGDTIVVSHPKPFYQSVVLASYPYTTDVKKIKSVTSSNIVLDTAFTKAIGWKCWANSKSVDIFVGNLTRNIVIGSENPVGTRGHVMFLHRAEIDVNYVEFRCLGRTTTDPLHSTLFDASGNIFQIGLNQIGRYAIHDHHLWGPVGSTLGFQFRLRGLSVWNNNGYEAKWGIVQHDSHFGVIADNISYNHFGANFVNEDGSETGNRYTNNISIKSAGLPVDDFLADFGDEEANHGAGFWFAAANNLMEDNVSVNPRRYGFVIESKFKKIPGYIPNFPGADMDNPAETTLVRFDRLAPISFARNETVGGLIGVSLYGSQVSGFKISNCKFSIPGRATAYVYYAIGVRPQLIGCEHQGDLVANGTSIAINHDRYSRWDIVNNVIEGFEEGVHFVGWQGSIMSNTTMDNLVNISISYGEPDGNTSNFIFDNITFKPRAGNKHIVMSMPQMADIFEKVSVELRNYLKPGTTLKKNYKVYFNEQAAGFIIPSWATDAPKTGITNQQLFTQYQMAVAGAVAPTTAKKIPEIIGLIS